MSAATLFIGSIAALIILIGLKMVEESRGSVLMPRLRSRADRAVLRGVVRSEQGLHTFVQSFSRKVILGSLRGLAMALITLLHTIEEKLVSAMALLRGRSGVRVVKNASIYLSSMSHRRPPRDE